MYNLQHKDKEPKITLDKTCAPTRCCALQKSLVGLSETHFMVGRDDVNSTEYWNWFRSEIIGLLIYRLFIVIPLMVVVLVMHWMVKNRLFNGFVRIYWLCLSQQRTQLVLKSNSIKMKASISHSIYINDVERWNSWIEKE